MTMRFAAFLLAVFLLIMQSAFAESQWEYQVVFLPGTVGGSAISQQPSGAYLDPVKTKILNELAKDGWEVITVTGASGADHAAYLRRPRR